MSEKIKDKGLGEMKKFGSMMAAAALNSATTFLLSMAEPVDHRQLASVGQRRALSSPTKHFL